MESWKKIGCFVVLCLFVLAAIGSTAWLFYFSKYLFAVANIALVGLAVPSAIKMFKYLIGNAGQTKQQVTSQD